MEAELRQELLLTLSIEVYRNRSTDPAEELDEDISIVVKNSHGETVSELDAYASFWATTVLQPAVMLADR